MITFLELAQSRYSVRKYSDKPVEKEKLEQILKAAQAAPTACNYQPWRVSVLQSPEAIAKVRSLTRYAFNAPVVLFICANMDESWVGPDGHYAAPIDAAIVITHMMLEACDLGIGSCWVRGFDKNKIAEAYGLPANLEPVAFLPLGYPAEGSHPAKGWHDKRKSLEETVEWL